MGVTVLSLYSLCNIAKWPDLIAAVCNGVVQFVLRHPLVCLINVLLLCLHLYLAQPKKKRHRTAPYAQQKLVHHGKVKGRQFSSPNKLFVGNRHPLRSSRMPLYKQADGRGGNSQYYQLKKPTHCHTRDGDIGYYKRGHAYPDDFHRLMPLDLGSRLGTEFSEDEASTLNEVTWTNEPSSLQFKVCRGQSEAACLQPPRPVDRLSDVAEETEVTSSQKQEGEEEEEGRSSQMNLVEENLTEVEKNVQYCNEEIAEKDSGYVGREDSTSFPAAVITHERENLEKVLEQDTEITQKSPSLKTKTICLADDNNFFEPPVMREAPCAEDEGLKSIENLDLLCNHVQTREMATKMCSQRNDSCSKETFSNQCNELCDNKEPVSHKRQDRRSPKTNRASSLPNVDVGGKIRSIKSGHTLSLREHENPRQGCDRHDSPEAASPVTAGKNMATNVGSKEFNWNSVQAEKRAAGGRGDMRPQAKGQKGRSSPSPTRTRKLPVCSLQAQHKHASGDSANKARLRNHGHYFRKSSRPATKLVRIVTDGRLSRRRIVAGVMGCKLTRGSGCPSGRQTQICYPAKERPNPLETKWYTEIQKRLRTGENRAPHPALPHQQPHCPSVSSHSCCTSGGGERQLLGNRSDATLVGKRDSWIWFSHEHKPSLENFASRKRRFHSQDPRVAQLAAEIRRQDERNRAIEREAGSIVTMPCVVLGHVHLDPASALTQLVGQHSVTPAEPPQQADKVSPTPGRARRACKHQQRRRQHRPEPYTKPVQEKKQPVAPVCEPTSISGDNENTPGQKEKGVQRCLFKTNLPSPPSKAKKAQSKNISEKESIKEASFPGVLLTSPLRSSSTSSQQPGTVTNEKFSELLRENVPTCESGKKAPSPSRSQFNLILVRGLNASSDRSTDTPREGSGHPCLPEWDQMSCASTKASTASLLNLNGKGSDIDSRSDAAEAFKRERSQDNKALSHVYSAESPPKTRQAPETEEHCVDSSVSFKSDKGMTTIIPGQIKTASQTGLHFDPAAPSTHGNNKTTTASDPVGDSFCQGPALPKAVKDDRIKSPHTQSLTTSTVESSDSMPKERLSTLRQVVLNNEVTDSVHKILFDMDQSSTSHSPTRNVCSKRSSAQPPSERKEDLSANQNSLDSQTLQRHRSAKSTDKHFLMARGNLRSSSCINVFTPTYYLGKQTRQRQASSSFSKSAKRAPCRANSTSSVCQKLRGQSFTGKRPLSKVGSDNNNSKLSRSASVPLVQPSNEKEGLPSNHQSRSKSHKRSLSDDQNVAIPCVLNLSVSVTSDTDPQEGIIDVQQPELLDIDSDWHDSANRDNHSPRDTIDAEEILEVCSKERCCSSENCLANGELSLCQTDVQNYLKDSTLTIRSDDKIEDKIKRPLHTIIDSVQIRDDSNSTAVDFVACKNSLKAGTNERRRNSRSSSYDMIQAIRNKEPMKSALITNNEKHSNSNGTKSQNMSSCSDTKKTQNHKRRLMESASTLGSNIPKVVKSVCDTRSGASMKYQEMLMPCGFSVVGEQEVALDTDVLVNPRGIDTSRSTEKIATSTKESNRSVLGTVSGKSVKSYLAKRHIPVSTLISGISDISNSYNKSPGTFKSSGSPLSSPFSLDEKLSQASIRKLSIGSITRSKESLNMSEISGPTPTTKHQTQNVSHLRKVHNFYGKRQMRITRSIGLTQHLAQRKISVKASHKSSISGEYTTSNLQEDIFERISKSGKNYDSSFDQCKDLGKSSFDLHKDSVTRSLDVCRSNNKIDLIGSRFGGSNDKNVRKPEEFYNEKNSPTPRDLAGAGRSVQNGIGPHEVNTKRVESTSTNNSSNNLSHRPEVTAAGVHSNESFHFTTQNQQTRRYHSSVLSSSPVTELQQTVRLHKSSVSLGFPLLDAGRARSFPNTPDAGSGRYVRCSKHQARKKGNVAEQQPNFHHLEENELDKNYLADPSHVEEKILHLGVPQVSCSQTLSSNPRRVYALAKRRNTTCTKPGTATVVSPSVCGAMNNTLTAPEPIESGLRVSVVNVTDKIIQGQTSDNRVGESIRSSLNQIENEYDQTHLSTGSECDMQLRHDSNTTVTCNDTATHEAKNKQKISNLDSGYDETLSISDSTGHQTFSVKLQPPAPLSPIADNARDLAVSQSKSESLACLTQRLTQTADSMEVQSVLSSSPAQPNIAMRSASRCSEQDSTSIDTEEAFLSPATFGVKELPPGSCIGLVPDALHQENSSGISREPEDKSEKECFLPNELFDLACGPTVVIPSPTLRRMNKSGAPSNAAKERDTFRCNFTSYHQTQAVDNCETVSRGLKITNASCEDRDADKRYRRNCDTSAHTVNNGDNLRQTTNFLDSHLSPQWKDASQKVNSSTCKPLAASTESQSLCCDKESLNSRALNLHNPLAFPQDLKTPPIDCVCLWDSSSCHCGGKGFSGSSSVVGSSSDGAEADIEKYLSKSNSQLTNEHGESRRKRDRLAVSEPGWVKNLENIDNSITSEHFQKKTTHTANSAASTKKISPEHTETGHEETQGIDNIPEEACSESGLGGMELCEPDDIASYAVLVSLPPTSSDEDDWEEQCKQGDRGEEKHGDINQTCQFPMKSVSGIKPLPRPRRLNNRNLSLDSKVGLPNPLSRQALLTANVSDTDFTESMSNTELRVATDKGNLTAPKGLTSKSENPTDVRDSLKLLESNTTAHNDKGGNIGSSFSDVHINHGSDKTRDVWNTSLALEHRSYESDADDKGTVMPYPPAQDVSFLVLDKEAITTRHCLPVLANRSGDITTEPRKRVRIEKRSVDFQELLKRF